MNSSRWTFRAPPTALSALGLTAALLLTMALPVRGAAGGRGGVNPGQAAYAEQLLHSPAVVPGIPEPTLLWPGVAPQAVPDANGNYTNEDQPAIYAFPAPADNNTGAAFLILPGGGFTTRCVDNEGVQIAKFLNRNGIAGFVLRYRIRPNYSNQVSFLDGHRAMQYLRAHAAEFKISPDRVGTIGFSAGSELEAGAFFNGVLPGDPTAADPLDRIGTRSNFNVLIYGGTNALRDPASAPPTFMFNTLEDSSHLSPEISMFSALRAAGVPVEAHWYQNGPHGTSMSPGDPELGQWPDLMVHWLRASGFLADGQRQALQGVLQLDGAPLASGYAVLTPTDKIGAPIIIARAAADPKSPGQFALAAGNGPLPGHYSVALHEDSTNPSAATPSQTDQRVFTKAHPGDPQDYTVEIKPDTTSLTLAVFSK